MKVIILEDDRVENVSDGYARNFLFPRRLAAPATAAALIAVAKRQDKKKAELEKRKAEMHELADKLSALELVITADAGEGGKLFGSVTTADLARAIKQTAGLEVDRRKIALNEPLKTVGDYAVNVKLFQDITASLKVKVAAK
ncbi:MAG: 50S ribosomal protein L9 [Candidatus Margulisbacteria bacterium]|nr:50S ribosomal protein L9 [Candidatus Margulisiibacteriota bacterium]